jgi:uncharacterized protein
MITPNRSNKIPGKKRHSMNDDKNEPSSAAPQYQSVTRDGKTVKIAVIQDGKGGWLLEVVDQYWNSTVWDEAFKTAQAALDEALRTIDEEGIDSLIGEPSGAPQNLQEANLQPTIDMLSDDELDELNDFLISDATSDNTMMLDCLDGFLTAIVSGPVMLRPSVWLPRVWGPSINDEPKFETIAIAERITGLIFRHLNSIISSLQQNPDTFEPVFDVTSAYQADPHDCIDGKIWSNGYIAGVELQRENWQPFFDEPSSTVVLRPIYLLGGDVLPDEATQVETPEQRDVLSKQIPASVAWIYRFWQPYRDAVAERSVATTFQRQHPKIGRNDPCPCGSGKKFKKCCGVSTVLH